MSPQREVVGEQHYDHKAGPDKEKTTTLPRERILEESGC